MSKKSSERNEALGLRKQLENFEFILCLVFQSKVLESINVVSKILQSPNTDLQKATYLLGQAKSNLGGLRHKFEDVVRETTELAHHWNIEAKITSIRQIQIKKFFDELLSYERIEDPLKAFRIRVFNKSLDILNEQITTRFISMNNVNELFSFLAPAAIAELRNEKLQEKATKLVEKYDLDLSFGL